MRDSALLEQESSEELETIMVPSKEDVTIWNPVTDHICFPHAGLAFDI